MRSRWTPGDGSIQKHFCRIGCIFVKSVLRIFPFVFMFSGSFYQLPTRPIFEESFLLFAAIVAKFIRFIHRRLVFETNHRADSFDPLIHQ